MSEEDSKESVELLVAVESTGVVEKRASTGQSVKIRPRGRIPLADGVLISNNTIQGIILAISSGAKPCRCSPSS
jgi:hypothetical protein